MSNNERIEPSNIPQFMFKKSNNTLIRDYVKSFLLENLTLIGMGHSELNMRAIDDLTSDITSDIYNSLLDYQLEELLETLNKKGGYVYNKTNKYNLNILLNSMKIKVYVGIAARIARDNYYVCLDYNVPDLERIRMNEIDRGIYRIEIYKVIKGFTINDYMKSDLRYSGFFNSEDERAEAREYYPSVDLLIEDFVNYVVDNYYWKWIDRLKQENPDSYEFDINDPIFYPNDNNLGNFVIAYGEDVPWYVEGKTSSRITCIDTDQWNVSSVHLMIHNIAIQIMGRLYSKDNFSVQVASKGLEKYRSEVPLFQRIQEFKMMFYEKIDKVHWFNEKDIETYSFWGSGVQVTDALMDTYKNELDRCGMQPHPEDKTFTEGFGIDYDG